MRSDLTLRGGQHGHPDAETFFNVLAPGVITKHLRLGATWTTSEIAPELIRTMTVGNVALFS